MKNLAAFGFGIVIAGLILLCIELTSRWGLKFFPHGIERASLTYPGNYFDTKQGERIREIMGPLLPHTEGNAELHKKFGALSNLPIWRLPDIFVTGQFLDVKQRPNGELIYAAKVSIDRPGLRRTPTVSRPQREFVFLGCSFTFGTGVDDEESLPSQFAKWRPRDQVYNFGRPGASPSWSLFSMQRERPDIYRSLGEGPKTVIYTYIEDHLERMIVRSNRFGPDWNDDFLFSTPFYEVAGDLVKYRGTVGEVRPWRNQIYKRAASSSFFRLFKLQIPPWKTAADYELVAKTLKTIEVEAQMRWPGSQFYVHLFPQGHDRADPKTRDALVKEGLQILDLSRVPAWQLTDEDSAIPGDGHPTRRLYQVVATGLHLALAEKEGF